MSMRIDFAKFAIPHDATNDELRDWINELYTMWANTSDLLAEYQEDEYVKVVRCRDCAYYDGEPDMESMGEKCWRDPSHSGRSIPTVADGFCWRGERKEGGDD